MGEDSDARKGARILVESAGVRALDELTLLDVSGDDTRSWLNGQLTNDVRHTKAGDAVYALAVSVKGKILADVWAFDRGDDRFWLAVPTASVAALLESFDGQIIMEDVEVEADATQHIVALAGPRADEVVTRVVDGGGGVFPTNRLGPGGRDVVVASDDEATLLALVAAAEEVGGGAVDEAAWELARVRRGVPRYGLDFDARNYPQEAGLKARAVSFEKGCYLGQEVVCMLESRGKLSKRLVVLSVAGDTPPDVDANIVAEDGTEIGRVTSSVVDGDSTLAFGYVKAAFAEGGRMLAIDDRRAEVTAVVG